MGKDCGSCTCRVPERAGTAERVVLATRVDHTATALRSLARSRGTRLEVLAPGLLQLQGADRDGERVGEFLLAAREALSSMESAEVRCLVSTRSADAGRPDVSGLAGTALLGEAMRAPSLAVAGARLQHADVLALFDDARSAFHSVYQPIVELAGGRTVGHEALLRATDSDGGIVLPEVLFPAAESAGWMHVLDRIGRTTALRQAGPWLGDDLLFINFVPTSIYRPQVCLATTEEAAEQAGLDLKQLVFEVTEGQRIDDVDHLASVFEHYRERGCRVALDDLGAGYSSLNMLVRLRPDFVKLDKEIVQSLPDPVSSAVVSAIVSITHSYGGTVLAECLETQAQADAARELGVDLGQGWLFGRPVRHTGTRVAPAPVGQLPPYDVRSRTVAEQPEPAPGGALPAGLEGLLTRAVASSANGVVVVDVQQQDMPVIHVNPTFCAATGYTPEEVLGRNCRILQGPDTDPATIATMSAAIRRGEAHQCVVLNYRQDGTPWWNELHLSPVHAEDGTLTHYLGFQYDVTARRLAEERLRYLSERDSLTGLLNRSSLLRELDAALVQGRTAARSTAVLFVDLDDFKHVNDSSGHLVGDRVLAEVASRLSASLRAGDVLARHGGDEFVVVLPGLDPLDAERVAVRVAEDLVEAVARPVPVGEGVARLGASIGVALDGGGGTSAGDLLREADAAMYASKRRGSGGVALAGEQRRLTRQET